MCRNRPRISIKFLNIETDKSDETVQTQIRLLLKEKSDQGLHCLPFDLQLVDVLPYQTELHNFLRVTVNVISKHQNSRTSHFMHFTKCILIIMWVYSVIHFMII